MEDLKSIIGANLVALRKAKGLTQQQLAKELNYSDKSISKWELGNSSPTIEVLKELATYYGISVDYLLKDNKDVDPTIVVSKNETNPNKAIIISLAITAVWLVDISVLLSNYFINDNFTFRWDILMWGVPSSFFMAAILCFFFFHKRSLTLTLFSCFLWTLVACFWLQYWLFSTPSQNIWYIFTVCVPLQVIFVLFSHLKKNPKNI